MKPVTLNIPEFEVWENFFHYGYITFMLKENLVLEIGTKINLNEETVCIFGTLGIFSNYTDYTKKPLGMPSMGEETRIVEVRHDYDVKDIKVGYEEVTKELQDQFNDWVNNFLV